MADDGQALGSRLRHQQAIEGIRVVAGQSGGATDVLEPNRQ
jgi:hypothetical protein